MIKYADGTRKKNKKQNGETRDIYIYIYIYMLQKQQTKNFIFPVVIASCLRTEMFLIEYHKVDQSLNMKTCNFFLE